MASPESLLAELGGDDPTIHEMISRISPLIVSFDSLATIDGWIIDLRGGTAGASFDDPGLDPDQRAINALLVACDYAVRRGAASAADARRILRRESPIAIPDPSPLCHQLQALVDSLGVFGLATPAFTRRRRGHSISGDVRSDPALSFEQRSMDQNIGDNSSSSLIVHNESAMDQVLVSGELNERWAVEVGLPASVGLEQITQIEQEIPAMPAFLHGVASYLDDDGIVVGWRHGYAPNPDHLGIAIHAWTKSLFDLPSAEVKIVFAPDSGESVTLNEMRARSTSLRLYRDAMRTSAGAD